MTKVKYRFNPQTLTYEEIPVTFKDRLRKFIWTVVSGLVFASITLFLGYRFFGSPREKMLEREVEQYQLQYEILNDRLDQLQLVLDDIQNRDDNIYRIIFEAEPIPTTVRKAGFGGTDRYARLDGYKNSEVIINTTQRIDQIASQLYVQSKSFDDVYKMAKDKDKMLQSIPAIQPLNNKDIRYISSYFGYRIHPIFKRRMFHDGIDMTAEIGTPVYATGKGKVIEAKRSSDGYGKKIMIDHGFGYKTVYAHLSGFKVRKYQKVERGQLIGFVGNTGISTGPHLHYEVRYNGRKVNPVYYFFNDLSPEEFEKIVDVSPGFNKEI